MGTFFTVMYVSEDEASKQDVLSFVQSSRSVIEKPMISSLLITDKIFDGKNLTVEELENYVQ